LEGYVDQPWAEDVVRAVAKRDSFGVMLDADEFADQPWAEDIIGPLYVRFYVDYSSYLKDFATQPWAEKYVRELAQKHPDRVMPEMDHAIDQAWAEPLIREIAVTQPHLILAHSYFFKDKPYYQEVVADVLGRVDHKKMLKLTRSYRHTCGLLSSSEVYQSEAWSEDVIRGAVKKSLHNTYYMEPSCLTENLSAFAHFPWAEGPVKRLAMQDSHDILENFESIEAQPWAEEVLVRALKRTDLNFNNFWGMAFSNEKDKDLLIGLAKKKPELVLENSSGFMSTPWSAEFFTDLAENNPEAVLKHADKFEDLAYGESVLETAKKALAKKETVKRD